FAQRFAENELFARVVASVDLHERVRAALGAEGTYDWWRPAWGDSERKFRMGDNFNIISGTSSDAYGFPAYGGVDPTKPWVATAGFAQSTGSLLGELDARLHQRVSVLVSGRADRSSRSAWLWSPRVALLAQLNQASQLRLIGQRAERLNTAEQLYYDA